LLFKFLGIFQSGYRNEFGAMMTCMITIRAAEDNSQYSFTSEIIHAKGAQMAKKGMVEEGLLIYD
jgi:hypothetical protein